MPCVQVEYETTAQDTHKSRNSMNKKVRRGGVGRSSTKRNKSKKGANSEAASAAPLRRTASAGPDSGSEPTESVEISPGEDCEIHVNVSLGEIDGHESEYGNDGTSTSDKIEHVDAGSAHIQLSTAFDSSTVDHTSVVAAAEDILRLESLSPAPLGPAAADPATHHAFPPVPPQSDATSKIAAVAALATAPCVPVHEGITTESVSDPVDGVLGGSEHSASCSARASDGHPLDAGQGDEEEDEDRDEGGNRMYFYGTGTAGLEEAGNSPELHALFKKMMQQHDDDADDDDDDDEDGEDGGHGYGYDDNNSDEFLFDDDDDNDDGNDIDGDEGDYEDVEEGGEENSEDNGEEGEGPAESEQAEDVPPTEEQQQRIREVEREAARRATDDERLCIDWEELTLLPVHLRVGLLTDR